jgi:hypothetical protein
VIYRFFLLINVPKSDTLIEAHRYEEVIQVGIEAHLSRDVWMFEDLDVMLLVQIPKDNLAVHTTS